MQNEDINMKYVDYGKRTELFLECEPYLFTIAEMRNGVKELGHGLKDDAPDNIKDAFEEFQKYQTEIRKYEDKYQEYALG